MTEQKRKKILQHPNMFCSDVMASGYVMCESENIKLEVHMTSSLDLWHLE